VSKKLVASSTRRSGGSRNAVNLSIIGYDIARSSANRQDRFTALLSTSTDSPSGQFDVCSFSLHILMDAPLA